MGLGYGFPLCATSARLLVTPDHIGRCLLSPHYLAFGHLSQLAAGDVQWTHIWKGFGALAGAYIFAALASRGFVQHEDHRRLTSFLRPDPRERLDHNEQEAPLEAGARVR